MHTQHAYRQYGGMQSRHKHYIGWRELEDDMMLFRGGNAYGNNDPNAMLTYGLGFNNAADFGN